MYVCSCSRDGEGKGREPERRDTREARERRIGSKEHTLSATGYDLEPAREATRQHLLTARHKPIPAACPCSAYGYPNKTDLAQILLGFSIPLFVLGHEAL